MTDYLWVYMTCGTPEEARAIGRALLESKTAACVNFWEGMQSMYWWQGQIQEDKEVVLVAKTRKDLFPQLEARVREIHGYEVPCIVALPMVEGHGPYLEWLGAAVESST